MKIARRLLLVVSLAALSVPTLHGATFIVPGDEVLIDESLAIVTGTVVGATARAGEHGSIETAFDVAVDEVLKGGIEGGRITVVEWGGRLGIRWSAMSGAPRYEIGRRYLIFLAKNRNGAWATQHLTLGRFEFARDGARGLLLRDAAQIHGWDTDGFPAVERRRDAAAFLTFIRERLRGDEARPAYFVDPAPARDEQRQVAPDFNGYDFVDAANVGVAAWVDDTGSDVNYSISGSPASNPAMDLSDGQDKIIEEDPQGVITGAFSGSGIVATAYWSGGANHTFEGKQYITIDQSDVITQNGVKDSSIGQSVFRTAMVHEIGHTLGFRHSNGDATDQASCAAPLPCSGSAVMNSSVFSFDGVLQAWDTAAVQAVYGNGGDASDYTLKFCANGGCTAFTAETGRRTNTNVAFRLAQLQVVCVPVSIPPAGQPLSKQVVLGVPTTLTVSALGTAPLTYQWYIGARGNTSQPTGTNSPTLNLTSAQAGTTSYWVRITNSCTNPPVDSDAATVEVICAGPSITTQPANATISEGGSAQLQVFANGSGLTYQWYAGNSGDTSQPVAGGTSSSIVVSPAQTASYWVRVSGACGSPVDSNTATVTVVPCADLTIDAPTATELTGVGRFRLNVTAFSASAPVTFQWFRGNTPGFGGSLVGTTQSVEVTVTAATSYWARVTNGCGRTGVTELITVAPCALPGIATQPADQTIANGATATLSIAVTRTDAMVTWYRGNVGDKSAPVGNGTAVTVGPLTETTKYWAEVSTSCGAVASRGVTITVEQTSTNLAMLQGRFRVQVRYRNQFANPVQEGLLTGRSLFNSSLADTAVFWFDSPLIVELMVRVSDARPFDNHYHVYYGGLSDVEFFISVTDTVTGKTVEYHKAANSLKGQVDRASFPAVPGPTLLESGLAAVKDRLLAPNADTSTLLMLSRYQVRMRYRNQFANPVTTGYLLGRSIANASTTDTAVFYFDNPESVEWMVRFSDVRPFATRVDFFHGGLSDVEYTVEVTDTRTGLQREYPIAPFSLAGAVDRASFVP